MEHVAAEDDACSRMTYVFLFASRSLIIHSTRFMRCAVSPALPSSLSADGCAGVRLASSDPIAGAVQGQLESASTPPVAVLHDEIDLHPPCSSLGLHIPYFCPLELTDGAKILRHLLRQHHGLVTGLLMPFSQSLCLRQGEPQGNTRMGPRVMHCTSCGMLRPPRMPRPRGPLVLLLRRFGPAAHGTILRWAVVDLDNDLQRSVSCFALPVS